MTNLAVLFHLTDVLPAALCFLFALHLKHNLGTVIVDV